MIGTIDEYISQCDKAIQPTLQLLRKTILNAAPDATEKISWAMATFVLYGNLVHFAAFKNHIGFYPGANGVEAFKGELDEYKTSKGAIQFPIGKPIPFDLITRIVIFKAEENKKAYQSKKSK